MKYKVINHYPNSPFNLGDILTYSGIETHLGKLYSKNEPQKFVRNPEKYPHIFKKLENENNCKSKRY